MNKKANKYLTDISQSLRKTMTPEEKHLWYDFLKKLPVNINRQKVIGPYVVDFYCASAKIAIELDGSQHYTENAIKDDKVRDNFLKEFGITVLRYTNYEIWENFRDVCKDILLHIDTSSVT